MSDIRFDFEWVDPQGARGPELRATWARLVIWSGSHCLSRVLDRNARSIRDGVYVPLYPLAEWFVTRWWSLLLEVPSPERVTDPGYDQRHNLRSARDGFALPSASISNEGEHIRLRWQREALPNYRVEFIEEGVAHVPREAFQDALKTFVAAVVQRLDSEGISETLLQTEWAALQGLSSEEEEFCEVTAALGLDPFSVDAAMESRIIRAIETIPISLRNDFILAASASNLDAQANDVSSAFTRAHNNETILKPLLDLRTDLESLEPLAGPPWSRGYLVAQQLRERLGLGSEMLPRFTEIAKALHIGNVESLLAALVEVPDATGVYDALVATNRHASPTFALNVRHRDAAQRFHFCRGLYTFLRADDEGPWLVTKSLSDEQKQSRAFAAEFLAPASALKDRVSGTTVSADEVDDIASEFGVSAFVIDHQLENHRIANVLPS
jgi:hypothetical protein